jgi:hypothetical protein
MFHMLAAAEAPHNICFLLQTVFRDKDRNRIADGLLSREAEQSLGAAVPSCDDAVKVLADDGVFARLYYRGQTLRDLLAAKALHFVIFTFDRDRRYPRQQRDNLLILLLRLALLPMIDRKRAQYRLAFRHDRHGPAGH